MKRMISLTLISALLISVCSCSVTGAEEANTEMGSVGTAVTELETTVTEIEVESEPVFTYETIEHTFPFSISSMSNDEYETFIGNTLISDQGNMTKYGFDNPYSLEQLRSYVYEQTGIYDDSITLADVGYFRGSQRMASYCEENFTNLYGLEYCPYYYLEMVRAILLTEDLRFGIDEIPYSYLERRFPQFINEAFFGSPCLISDIDTYSLPIDVSVSNYPDDYANTYAYDVELFCSCLYYNQARYCYIYNNPHGGDEILQVRDELTGRNILVPTESQYEQLMEDINSMPDCENIDIYQVETREDFYDSYGVYPEDVLAEEYMYELNRTAVVQSYAADDNT